MLSGFKRADFSIQIASEKMKNYFEHQKQFPTRLSKNKAIQIYATEDCASKCFEINMLRVSDLVIFSSQF